MRPEKPSPDFPLYAHARGKWAKKIDGKIIYFGRWDDPAGALAEYERLLGARGGDTLSVAVSKFMDAQEAKAESGELSLISLRDYRSTGERLISFLGDRNLNQITTQDWERYKSWRLTTCNLNSVGNEITRIKTIFGWFRKQGLLERVTFGDDFRRPSAKSIRRERRGKDLKLYTPDQVMLLLDECGLHMRAMVLLGINCAFGPTDIALLPLPAYQGEWMKYPRTKTEVERRAWLWPETREALEASLRRRYKPNTDLGRFFVMPSGQHWDGSTNPIQKQYRQASIRAGMRDGGFYWLRSTFATVAGETLDQPAVDTVMGHVDRRISGIYRQLVSDERLISVSQHVRKWLLSDIE